MAIRDEIYAVITSVATEQDRKIAPLSDGLVFMESGLDSLCFAIIVARLEDQIGIDPFTASDDVIFPSTLGGFVALYDNPIH